jgi:hypothetical protein
LVLTIVNLSVGPFISGTMASSAGTWNCQEYKDNKDDLKKNGASFTDEAKKHFNSKIDWCTRIKGMHDMEYTAFIFDIVIGFICGLVGLLHLFDLKKDFVSNTGLIGLICGFIGFVFTFVYVIFNGMVFTSKYSDVVERDGDGIFAQRTEKTASSATYKCLNYDDSGDAYWGYAKISELNKKQYNYKKDFYNDDQEDCKSSIYESRCHGDYMTFTNDGTFTVSSTNSLFTKDCKNVYAGEIDEITNKDKFDRFLTTLILGLIVCLANIGLALFGFLLFRTPGDF